MAEPNPTIPAQGKLNVSPNADKLTIRSRKVAALTFVFYKLTPSCFRIMLATDNHIGYAEKDPIRGQDAINTFREILELARAEEVDYILLAGDLFHENKPSRGVMHQTIALLREYTMGDKAVSVRQLSGSRSPS
jgi:metallophosphoesterase superfamily enzyme